LSKVSPQTKVDLIGLAAADALSKAIKSSIMHAKSIEGFPAYKSL
jgi:L-aminopeptidase/D-esterase-like protein